MTITAKFEGKCKECGGVIRKGARINWARGRGASHVNCELERLREVNYREQQRGNAGGAVAPCWDCKAEDGRFRAHGAATPVLCDACEERYQRMERKLCPDCGRVVAKRGYRCNACANAEEFGMNASM